MGTEEWGGGRRDGREKEEVVDIAVLIWLPVYQLVAVVSTGSPNCHAQSYCEFI